MRWTIFLLLLGALAFAQDSDNKDCPSKGGDCAPKSGDCSDCSECTDCTDCGTDAPTAKLVTSADCAQLCDDLAAARKDLKIARSEFKGLARVEQDVLKDARAAIYRKSAGGRAMAPGFGATADLLTAAAAEPRQDAKLIKLYSDMADSFRSMAKALDKKERYLEAAQRDQKPAERAEATSAKALAALTEAAKAKASETEATNWRVIKKGDPQYRALARNMKALREAWQVVPAQSKHIARARQIVTLLEKNFDGVETERPTPPPAMPAP